MFMATFAVLYTYTDDAAGRDMHRAEHREFLNTSGWTLLSGPLTDPAGALLIVEAESAVIAASLLDADPFYRAGLVAERTIRAFDPVGGAHAAAFAAQRN